MEINWTQIIIALVVGLLIPGYRAWKAGKLNVFLAQRIEDLASSSGDEKMVKTGITTLAVSAGVQGLLDKVVGKAGLKKSSGG